MVAGRFFVLIALAFAWGLSEATFFFVVPDVVISFIALEYGYKSGFLACAAAVAGAMLGGTLMYAWGGADINAARAFFDHLPAIAPSTIERAGVEVSRPDLGLAMLRGSLTGVPFKLYASEAGAAGTSVSAFVALTPLVRLPRFVMAVALAGTVHSRLPEALKRHKLKLLSGFWLAFYAIYWLTAPW
jgi:membrane protein YqaA with SNARE-associated domain